LVLWECQIAAEESLANRLQSFLGPRKRKTIVDLDARNR
jgi:hypothetical protein